jgi:opacity protein-like surface antigen
MKRWSRKLVAMLVVVLMALGAGGFAAAAYAAPPARQSATITTDGKACTVTAMFTWKNYDPAVLSGAFVSLSNLTQGTEDGMAVGGPYWEPAGSDELIYTELKGVSGHQYQAAGGLIVDGEMRVSESNVMTLRCQTGGGRGPRPK